MIILAIETSCDDTCISLIKVLGKLKPHFKILSNIISSQIEIHRKWGGVYPALAKREHQKNLPLIFKKALRVAGNLKIDLIAVTIGPGLEPCLWVGINFAKDLAKSLKIPIIPVSHIEAHIYANWLSSASLDSKNIFPAVCLIVSGGHSQLILMKGHGKYKILGETRDDAAGECFDKVARILGLGYPGGPTIEAEASKFRIQNSKFRIRLPRPMIYQKNYDFSFSGLKTAVLYDFRNRPPKIRESETYIQAMCQEIQQSVTDVLIFKTLRAAKDYKTKSIILGGGVTANKNLRKELKTKIEEKIPDTKCFLPDIKYCTDNAAMVGIAAYFHWLKRKDKILKEGWKEIEANANLKI